jgi:hypothetical protein
MKYPELKTGVQKYSLACAIFRPLFELVDFDASLVHLPGPLHGVHPKKDQSKNEQKI